ncbi:MAG: AAA family ATPase [Rhodospirillales bacterium]
MSFEAELDLHLRARFTLVLVATQEEERALQILQTVCERADRACFTWDVAEGFRAILGNAPPTVRDPVAALEHIEAADTDAVFVLIDFHELWSDPRIKRKLRSVAQRLKSGRKSIVVTLPGGPVPRELRDLTALLEMPPPGAPQISDVLTALTQDAGVRQDLPPPEREKLVQAALGLSTAQAQRVFARAVASHGQLDAAAIGIVTREKKEIIRDSEALEFFSATETPADVGGLEVLKVWLHQRERAFTREAHEYGLPAPRGLALIGIPGTGKSLTAKMIGGMWRLPLLRLDIAAVFGSQAGSAEERTRRALRLAEAVAPCVLWIDEIEKALAHGGADLGSGARVLGTILTWMQEKTAPCFVVGTANDVDSLPPELLRRGRFDEIFFLDLPTTQERMEIIAVHLKRRSRSPANFDLPRLARECSGYVGSEIEQAIIDAMYVGFSENREFVAEDISASLRRQVPLSVSSRARIDTLRRWLTEGRVQSASLREVSFARDHSIDP